MTSPVSQSAIDAASRPGGPAAALSAALGGPQ